MKAARPTRTLQLAVVAMAAASACAQEPINIGSRLEPMVEGHVITKGAFDSLNLAFWDELRGCHVEFHRGIRDGVRDVMAGTSDDFLHWTDPV